MEQNRMVDAAPFRAHLRHVCATSGIEWPVAALQAGLPVGLVRNLLDVRPGRRVMRIAPELALEVLDIQAPALVGLRRTTLPARGARLMIRRLTERHWSLPLLARRLHVTAAALDAVAAGLAVEVPALLHYRLGALVASGELGPRRIQRRTGTAA